MGARYVLLVQLYLLRLTRSNRPGEEDIRMGAKATRTRRQPAPCGHPWHAPHQQMRYSLAGVPGKAPHDAQRSRSMAAAGSARGGGLCSNGAKTWDVSLESL